MSASRPVDAAARARVAVLERRGKFLVAEPFFAPGPRLVVSRDKRFSLGDLVVVRPPCRTAVAARASGGGGRAVIARRLGRPDVARDVIEALMIDRGLRRGFDPAVEHEARESAAESGARPRTGAATSARCRRSRSTPRARATSTTRSRRSGSARRRGVARVGAHRRRLRLRRAALARRSRGVPARHERLRARRRRADASQASSRTTPARSCPSRTDPRSRSRWWSAAATCSAPRSIAR